MEGTRSSPRSRADVVEMQNCDGVRLLGNKNPNGPDDDVESEGGAEFVSVSERTNAQGHTKSFLVMIVLVGAYFFVELGAGIVLGSLALESDALHMAGDLIALCIGLYAERVRTRTAPNATYGFVRADVVGSLVNSTFLISTCFFIGTEALSRLRELDVIAAKLEGEGLRVVAVAVVGLVVNIAGLFLFGGHHHGHDHSHGHTHNHGSDGGDVEHQHHHPSAGSDNIKAVFLHVLGDALGSVAVVISGVVIHFGTSKYRYLVDPLTSLIFVIFIAYHTFPLLLKTTKMLMQFAPGDVDVHGLTQQLFDVKGVIGVHDLHVWQLDTDRKIGTVHILCVKGSDIRDICNEAKSLFHKNGIHSSAVQTEIDPLLTDEQSTCRVEECTDRTCGTEACIMSQCCNSQEKKALEATTKSLRQRIQR